MVVMVGARTIQCCDAVEHGCRRVPNDLFRERSTSLVPPLEFVCTLLYFAYVVYVWYLGTDTYQRAVAYNI